ncbi:MAG: ribbon-helix-helix protein, CopG family [Deltaproteobacteria bacterium]|nr:ribbon-helix-helix protein, CopG family [Deltaproteobacteria bacterium]
MADAVSLRLSGELMKKVDRLAELLDRPRSYLIRKALEAYLAEYADYQIALDRLRDKDDAIIATSEMRKKVGL